jgi:hypothetical protein
MLDALIFVVLVVAIPTVVLSFIVCVGAFTFACVQRKPFSWAARISAFSAACRLQLAFVLGPGVLIAALFGQVLYLGTVPLISFLTLVVGVLGFVVLSVRGIPLWLTWQAWRRVLSWPFRSQ